MKSGKSGKSKLSLKSKKSMKSMLSISKSPDRTTYLLDMLAQD